MRIVGGSVIPLRCALSQPLMDARVFFQNRDALLLELRTDEGLVGLGEAAVFGGALSSVAAILENEVLKLVIGEDPFRIERVWEKVYQRTSQHGRRGLLIMALSAVDVALWDIVGKAVGKPVYELLGGYSPALIAYASGGFYADGKDASRLADEMAEYVERGFRAVKMKVARSPSADLAEADRCRTTTRQDLERVGAVRRAIGDDRLLLLDANNGWDVKTAIRFMNAAQEYDPYMIEEPVSTDDLLGSAQVAAAVATPVAGYETAYTRFEFAQLVESRAVDIVQPDVTWTGGITEARRIAIHAGIRKLRCFPHSFGSAVGLAASAHLLASLPNAGFLEVDCNPNPLREHLVLEPINVNRDGMVLLNGRPGLGVELDLRFVQQHKARI